MCFRPAIGVWLVQLQSKDLFEAYVSKLGAFLHQKRLQSFKVFVLTGLQEDKDMVALVAMMVLMARSQEQGWWDEGGSREVELTHLSNSCETLKSGLPAPAADALQSRPRSAATSWIRLK